MYTIPFAPVSVNSNELNIENIGDFAVCGTNEVGQEYYMIVQTELGLTRILTYGPAIHEIPLIPCKSKMSFVTILYDSKKITGAVSQFLLINGCIEAEVKDKDEILKFVLSSIGGLIR